MSTQPAPIEVFYSYADPDEELRSGLEKHLSQLSNDGLIISWHKRKVIAGQDRREVLDQHLNAAPVILLLVSPDFVDSDYCYGIEMRRAMERHNAGEARVIPILLRPVDWHGAPFGKLQALPDNGKPITEWRNRDAAFADIAQGIRAALQDVQLLTASTPSTALPRIWNIPHRRNLMFTGREETLTHLASALKTNQAQAQAISGLGGVGKTQIAVEYAYRHHQDYQAVFWTLADTRESLISGYVAIAGLLNLPEKDEQDTSLTVKAVLRWLSTHTEWLLILDNADDLAVVREFVPSVFGGRILLTTRAQAPGRLARRIEVDIMLPDIGALFLMRRALLIAPDAPLEEAAAADVATAREICEELGGLPLALDQAGAYLEQTGCGLTDYQKIYRDHRQRLLAARAGVAAEHPDPAEYLDPADHPDPVATTWSISFDRVAQKNILATQVLSLCAFLSANTIPLEVMTDGPDPLEKDLLTLLEAIADLRAYSLVKYDSATRALSIHPLVQVVIRDAMTLSERTRWHERAIQLLDAVFPDVTVTIWPQCERLLSHVLVTANVSPDETQSLELGRCLRKAATYLIGRARYGEAEPLLQRARQITEQLVAPDPFELTVLINGLAVLSLRQGKYAQAESLLQQILQLIEDQSGSDHFLAGITLSNLGITYLQQGKYVEAEPLLQQALQLIEDQLGSDHPLKILWLSNLGLTYFQQGKYAEAEPLLQHAVQTLDQPEDFVHHDFVLALSNLALVYDQQGKYAEAESMLQRALRIGEQQLGSDHPTVAILLANLAQLYINQDKYAEAEPLLRQALQICEQRLDSDPTYPITTLLSLADLYYQQDKYAETEPLLQQALQICEQRLGSDHPLMASVLGKLGDMYRKQDKYAEAESVLQRALQICEQRFSPDHFNVTGALIDLAILYKAQQKYAEAELLYQRALQIREQQLDPNHLEVAHVLHLLAGLYFQQSKYARAESLYQRALQIREQQLGPNHLRVASTLEGLANLYYWQDKNKKAEPLYLRALQIREQHQGPDHLDLAHSLNGLANIYREQLKRSKAASLCERVLEIRQKHQEPDHLDIASALQNLARVYRSQGGLVAAEFLYLRATQIREQKLGHEHPKTRGVRKDYVLIIWFEIAVYCVLFLIFSLCLITWFFHKFDILSWIVLALAVLSGLRLTIGGYSDYRLRRNLKQQITDSSP